MFSPACRKTMTNPPVETPPADAVVVTWAPHVVGAVTEKLALRLPAGTVTLAGKGNACWLELVNATTVSVARGAPPAVVRVTL
jgi:hypothetical protein